mgnify:CR=1 FL=1
MCPVSAPVERGPADVAATNDLAWSLRHTDPERAHTLAYEALRLTGGDQSDPIDHEGAATALTTLGFLERQRGRLQRALAHCLRAAELQSGMPITRATSTHNESRITVSNRWFRLSDQTVMCRWLWCTACSAHHQAQRCWARWMA